MALYMFYVLLAARMIEASDVELTLDQPFIKLGESTKLNCRYSHLINISESTTRQWTGGKYNRLLCFDGVTVDQHKYQEELHLPQNFTLYIENTDEEDLRCPYTCRVGFDSGEKFLDVNENNFIHVATNDAVNFSYGYESNYFLDLNIERVFPLPVCSIHVKNKPVPLPVIQQKKRIVLYNVSYHLNTSYPLHDCASNQITIRCQIGNETRIYHKDHEVECFEQDIDERERVVEYFNFYYGLAAATIVLLVIVFVFWYRKYVMVHDKEPNGQNNKNQYLNSPQEMDQLSNTRLDSFECLNESKKKDTPSDMESEMKLLNTEHYKLERH